MVNFIGHLTNRQPHVIQNILGVLAGLIAKLLESVCQPLHLLDHLPHFRFRGLIRIVPGHQRRDVAEREVAR
jgi:hypothetical protein